MQPKTKKRGGCLIPILVILVIIFIVVLIIAVAVSSSGGGQTAKKSLLAETMGLTEQQEQDMLTVFEQCGITEIKAVTLMQSGQNRTSYYVDDDETEHYNGADNTIVVWVDNDSKAVEGIYFHDNEIFVDGAVVAQVPQFYVSAALRDQYRVDAQLLVK